MQSVLEYSSVEDGRLYIRHGDVLMVYHIGYE
jgi:hypothetical protein